MMTFQRQAILSGLLFVTAACVPRTGFAQSSYGNTLPTTNPYGRTPVDRDAIAGELSDPSILHRREEARKLDRKRRMVDSANRLLALTEQLRADLQGREMTPEDEKRLDEIAKLARQVKDQMRN